MRPGLLVVLAAMVGTLSPIEVQGTPKPHVISFGKISSVKWMVGAGETQAVDLKVRPLLVDTRLKEYTTGPPHDVTDRLFAIRRVFRLNDNLPDEPATTPRWRWARGG